MESTAPFGAPLPSLGKRNGSASVEAKPSLTRDTPPVQMHRENAIARPSPEGGGTRTAGAQGGAVMEHERVQATCPLPLHQSASKTRVNALVVQRPPPCRGR